MFKLDNSIIKDRFRAAAFSFYTDSEIERLSVKKIINPSAFDHLNNPTDSGLYDKAMGVSPFDHRGQINTYVMCLKLIKSGELIHSTKLKNYFMHAAKEIHLSGSDLNNEKKLKQLKNQIESLVLKDQKDRQISNKFQQENIAQYFRSLDEKFNSEHQNYEDELISVFEEIKHTDDNGRTHFTKEVPLFDQIQTTTLGQKFLKEIIHEMWQQVVTTDCPNCKGKSPSIRKDGYTKFFQKALSERTRNQLLQQDRLENSSFKRKGSSNVRDDAFEIITEASTQGKNSRKHSNKSNDIDSDESEEIEEEDEDKQNKVQQKYLTPQEVKDQIEALWNAEYELLSLIFGRYYPNRDKDSYESDTLGAQMFFLQKLLVPPNRFRPESQGAFGGAGPSAPDKSFLHAHSALLTKILVLNLQLSEAIRLQVRQVNVPEGRETSSDVVQKWIQLQDAINTFVDSSLAQKTADREQNGLRQLLERKEGMFRMKMMGKRVNFGARSVISPDPYITTDQIGVPIFMAKKLTFPESVSDQAYERLRKMVINGTHQHPGANMIEDEETGQRTHLDTLTLQQRKGLANQLKVGRQRVYRHLVTGDVLLVNRQPTLHKPSIMAHIARILPKEQTIRMHYSNCSTYNADFDGDEMNLHFPQSYLAQSEARRLMATHKQYIVPTSGKPIRGLIQDSVISGVFLSSKDTFLTKEVYMQLVYVGLSELLENEKIQRIFTLQPAVYKPRVLYTGKQVISTILKNIVNNERDYKKHNISGMNLDSKAKLSAKEWGSIGPEEGDVIFRDNELLQGTIDKAQFGASEYGMIHSFYEIYGSEKAGELLTSLGRIFTMYLQIHGFTCGTDDMMLTPQYNKKRREIIEGSHREGIEAAAAFCGLKNYKAKQYNYSNRVIFSSEGNRDPEIDHFTNMALPEDPFTNKQTLQMEDPIRKRLEEKFASGNDQTKLDTELDNVIKSKVNNATSQVLKICIPDGLLKRFPRNNISAMVLTGAKGGIVNMTQIVCMLGQQELEGKRVPKMQNGKTLPCFLPYDPNPRSSGYVSDRFIDGLRPQDFFFHCMAGREGLIDTAVKTSRSGYLQRCLIKQLESLIVQYDMTVRDNDGSIIQFLYGEDGIDVMNTKYVDKFKFLEQNCKSVIRSYDPSRVLANIDSVTVDKLKNETRRQMKLLHREKPHLSKSQLYQECSGDPIISRLHPLKYFGAISEKQDEQLRNYLKHECTSKVIEKQGRYALKQKYKPQKEDFFRKMYYLKYMESVAEPGENVGTIAAQSIGEPSTQMTLNTFHLAGHGAENMTLGIPRLKEILMTAPTNIKTPNMTVYFRKDKNITKEQMEQFSNKFKRLKLADIIKEVKVEQSINQSGGVGEFNRFYNVTLEIDNFEKVNKQLGISFEKIVEVFSNQFVPLLMTETLKQLRKMTSTTKTGDQQETKTQLSRMTPMKSSARSNSKKGRKSQQETDDLQQNEDFSKYEEEQIRKDTGGSSKKKSEQQASDDDDEDDEEEKEFNSDIDGAKQHKKKETINYDQGDEFEEELISLLEDTNANELDEESEQQIITSNDEEARIRDHCNILKEKYQKFFGYIKQISEDRNKSCSVLIGFPLEFRKVLMITIAESLLSKILIRSVQGIEKCTLITPSKPNEDPFLLVQGLNFDAFWRYPNIVDVYRIQSNDIMAIKKKYGIEAARANIVKEIRSVFSMYGIEVNYRHLTLVSDFITFNGEYRPFNRIGMEESSSPFLKMSFETTMKYLINSCMTKDVDNMSTPSSALVLGQVPKMGTGIFDVMVTDEVAQ